MFETENYDVMDDSSTSDDIMETTDESVVEQDFENQSEVQGDIQDTTQSEQTIPYDRFSEVNERNKELADTNRKLMELLGRSQPQQQQINETEKNILDEILDDDLLTGKDLKKVLQTIEHKQTQNYQHLSQAQKQTLIEQHESILRTQAPDYDDVIKNLDPKLVQTLYSTYDDPSELVKVAYKVAKGLTPQKASASEIAKANNTQQVKTKPVIANDIKGGATGKSVDAYLDEKFNSW